MPNKLHQLLSVLIDKTPYARTILANLGIRKLISYGQKTGLLQFDHYTDTYWNDLGMVQQYINQNATGNQDTIWQLDISKRFADCVPLQNCLVIGCGNGWVERQLCDIGAGLRFDAFDISEKYLQMAKKQRDSRPINYFKADLDHLESLKQNHYDAVFNVGALHHGFRLARTLWRLNQSLKPDGLMFNFDYVGPAQHMYSDEHLKILQSINQSLPESLQSRQHFRPTKEDFAFGDPTEAVNADLVRPCFERFFDIIYQKELNGGIGYPLLVNNTKPFQNNDKQARHYLKKILDYDRQYTLEKKIPVLFWYGVGKPKKRQDIPYNEFLPR